MRIPRVEKAVALADSLGFKNSCLNEVGELLNVLVGSMRSGRIAEIGTGCGVSTAWMASATELDLYTIDHDNQLEKYIQSLFIDAPNVHSIIGDWELILQKGPFHFMFVDAKPAKLGGIDKVVNAVEVGGLILLDDLTPTEFWPNEWKGQVDPVRESWLNHRQLASIEIRTSYKAAAILARRI